MIWSWVRSSTKHNFYCHKIIRVILLLYLDKSIVMGYNVRLVNIIKISISISMPFQTGGQKGRAFQGYVGAPRIRYETKDISAEQILATEVFISNAPVLATLRESSVGTSEQEFLRTRAGGIFQSFATQNNFPVIEVVKATDMYLQQ